MYQSTCTPAFVSLCWSFRANFASSPAPIPEQGFRARRSRQHSLQGRISEPVSTNYKPWNGLIHHPGVAGWLWGPPPGLPTPIPFLSISP